MLIDESNSEFSKSVVNNNSNCGNVDVEKVRYKNSETSLTHIGTHRQTTEELKLPSHAGSSKGASGRQQSVCEPPLPHLLDDCNELKEVRGCVALQFCYETALIIVLVKRHSQLLPL